MTAPASWAEQAECKALGPNDWFGPDDELPGAAYARVGRNRRVCQRCPVRVECGTYAVEHGQSGAVWAGFNLHRPIDRKALRAWLAGHDPADAVVIPLPVRRPENDLSGHPEAVKARRRRQRRRDELDRQRRHQAAEAWA